MSASSREVDSAKVAAAFFAVVGMVALVVAIVAAASIVDGIAFRVLWSWFVVDTIPGMPALTLPQAIGIGLTIALLRYKPEFKKDERENLPAWHLLFNLLGAPFMFLLVGYVVKRLM